MVANFRMASLALLLAGLGSVSAVRAGLGPIHVLSADGEAFSAEIPVVNEEIENFAQADLADRNRYALLSPYSGSASLLQFGLIRGGDGHIQKVTVKGPASFNEPLLRFAVEVRWPDGRLVREFEVDYKRDGPRRKAPAPASGDDGKRHVASPDQGSRLDGAGLGELKVNSRLGEPLQAELRLLGGVFDKAEQVQVAIFADASQGEVAPEQVQQVASIAHKLDRSSDGRHVLQLASSLPITAPRLAFRLEVRAGGVKVEKRYALMLEDAPAADPAADHAKPPVPAAPETRVYLVRKGDSLSAIAARVRGHASGEDVAGKLLKDNPDAFIRGDANRLLAGAELRYPAQWTLRGEPVRHPAAKAASAGDGEAAAKPGSMAKLLADARPAGVAKAEDNPPTPSAASGKPAASSPAALAAERRMRDMLALQDRALKQTEERARALEAQIRAMQQNKDKAAAAPPAAAMAPPLPTPAKPAARPAPAVVQTPPASAARSEPPVQTDKPKPAVVVTAVTASAPRPTAPTMSPAEPRREQAKAPLVPHAAASSVMDDALAVLGDRDVQLRLGGAGAALALVALLLMRRKRAAAAAEQAEPADEYGGGKDVPSSMLTLGPLTSLMSTLKKGDGIDLDSVDPMAEAEVYLAYGRDDQVLLILREGLEKEPARQDLRYKLLEVLSTQPDRAAFLEEAARSRDIFGKDSTQWMRVCELGRAAMPGHPLFETAQAPHSVEMPAVGSLEPVAPAAAAAEAIELVDAAMSEEAVTPPAPPAAPVVVETMIEAEPEPAPLRAAPAASEAEAESHPDPEKLELAKLYMEMGDKETAEILIREAQQGR